jgi:enoyl-[acyl-carrier-protein] reductase (NADH)
MVSGLSAIRDVYRERTPSGATSGRRSGGSATFSPPSRGITGEIVMVDAGYHVTGM